MKTILSLLILSSIVLLSCSQGGDQEGDTNNEARTGDCKGIERIEPAFIESKNTAILNFTKGSGDLCIYVSRTGEKGPAGSEITIDGKDAVPHSDFKAKFAPISNWFTNDEFPEGDHVLEIAANGKPGTGLEVRLYEDDGEPVEEPGDRVERVYRDYLAESPDEQMDFYVMLTAWTTPQDLFDLIQHEDAISMKEVFVELRRNEDNFTTFKADMGSKDEIIAYLDYLKTEHSWCLSCDEIKAHMDSASLNDGSILFYGLRVSSVPETMTEFWNANPEQVRFVQAIRNSFDNSGKIYRPEEEAK